MHKYLSTYLLAYQCDRQLATYSSYPPTGSDGQLLRNLALVY